MSIWPVFVEDRTVAVEVSDAVYPIAAIHGAAVLFIERAFLRVATPRAGRTRVELRPKRGAASEGELGILGGEFLNELLHQALRLDVGARTEKLRELVIGKAVMSAEGEDAGAVAFHDDPLGIARPWEERYLGEDNGGRK